MIKHYKSKQNRIRPIYQDIMDEIWRQKGDDPFFSSDLSGVDYNDIKRLLSGNYLVKSGRRGKMYHSTRGLISAEMNLYRVNNRYIEYLKRNE